MFQKFFTNTVTSRFIKNLISNTYLPILKTVRDGDFIVKGCQYIYQNTIIECTKTGVIFGSASPRLTALEDLFIDDGLILNTGIDTGEYKVVDIYVFGESYKNITYQYHSKYDFYDGETHYQLGQYLRCLRDLSGIDLMPFYNCFNYRTINGIYLDKDSQNGYVEKYSNKYDLYAIPIKFNQIYTVAFTCKFNALLKSVLCNDMGLIQSNYQQVRTTLTDLIDERLVCVSNSCFNHPFTYEIKADSKYLLSFENDLYLIIQLPRGTKTSVVVLEGDYTQSGVDKTFDMMQLKYAMPGEVDKLFIRNPSLLQFDDKNIYAFSDKLVEYLTLNVIDKNDSIVPDIYWVQERVRSIEESIRKRDGSPITLRSLAPLNGEWDSRLRCAIYDLYTSNYNKVQFDVFDIDGYVDKRVENYIAKDVVI